MPHGRERRHSRQASGRTEREAATLAGPGADDTRFAAGSVVGDAAIGPTLARVVRQADDVGFDSIWVMDHFIQIRSVGRPEEPMLEGMTALGFMAAHSTRARLGLLVGGVGPDARRDRYWSWTLGGRGGPALPARYACEDGDEIGWRYTGPMKSTKLEERVVSLLPAATEIVIAVGGESALVGLSHLCPQPEPLHIARAEDSVALGSEHEACFAASCRSVNMRR